MQLGATTSYQIIPKKKWNTTLPNLIGYFAIVDLLFLPYLQILIMPISLPVIAGAFILFRTKSPQDKALQTFVAIAILATTSTLISVFLKESNPHLEENIKRLIQLLSSFLYFFYFKWLTDRGFFKIKPIIIVFLLWFTGLSIAFSIDPATTQNLLQSLYGRLVVSEEKTQIFLRFAYLFPDPNTAAYFFLIALSPLLLAKKKSSKQTFLFALILMPILFSQSRGALIAYILVVLTSIFPPTLFYSSILNAKKLVAVLGILTLLAVIVIMIGNLSTDPLFELIFNRLFQDEESYSTGGSRFKIWSFYISKLAALPLGRGFQFDVENHGFYPHSDFLRLTYSYGIIATIIVTTFLFHNIKKYPQLVIPALAAFSINTLIDDQKLFALYLSLLALSPQFTYIECLKTTTKRLRPKRILV